MALKRKLYSEITMESGTHLKTVYICSVGRDNFYTATVYHVTKPSWNRVKSKSVTRGPPGLLIRRVMSIFAISSPK